MPVELVEIGTSAGLGIVDNILVELEEKGKITGNLVYIKDGIRIIAGIGGLIANYVIAKPGTLEDKLTRALGLAGLPLAMHSFRTLMKKAGWLTLPSATAAGFQPVQTMVPTGVTITSY